MIESRPIDVDGRFVGIAVHASVQWHFVAADPVLDDLHGTHFPDLDTVKRTARLVMDRARGAHRPHPVAPPR